MKIITIFISALLYCCLLGAQKGQSLFKDITPSPNSCALAQYVDYPVSLYTGTPSINIPIHTIETGPYSFPINLSYHASGIRVAQEATWVGLGWCLNAGGVITRTIRGKDDLGTGYYYNETDIPDVVDGSVDSEYIRMSHEYGTPFPFLFPRLSRDAEPDVFYYNFGGYTGRFYCKLGGHKLQQENPGSGFIYSNPEDNLKIEEIELQGTTTFIGFRVTVPDGTSYCFVQPEIKYSRSYTESNASMSSIEGNFEQGDIDPSNPADNHVTAWYLKDIYYPNGDRITFEYDEELNAYVSPVRVSQHIYTILAQDGKKFPYDTFTPKATYSADLTVEYPRLRRISWKNGHIDFVASQDKREDVRSLYYYKHNADWGNHFPARALQEIKICGSDKEPQPLSKYYFHTSYFTSSDSCKNYLSLRLRLDSITVTGTEARSVMYRMEYDTTHLLPRKNSFSCDHWGYYNGIKNNCLYPSMITDQDYEGFAHNIIIPKGTHLPGANRGTLPDYVTSCMLTAFETPEGGRTEFTYEPKAIDGEKVKIPLSDEGTWKETLRFVKPASEHLKTSRFYMPFDGYVDYDFMYGGNEFHAEEEKGTVILGFRDRRHTAKDINWDDRSIRGRKVYLTEGFYTFDMQSNTTVVEQTATLKLYKVPYYKGLPLAGGVRIAQIKSPSTLRKYQYMNDNWKSSGIQIRNPLYAVREVSLCYDVSPADPGNYYVAGRTVVLNRSSGSVNPMESPTAGVAVGYSQVSVLTDTLREDFYYYNRKEKDGAVPGFPGEFIFQNGKLRRNCIYENERMTKATYYTYQEREIMRLKALREDPGNFFVISKYHIPITFCAVSHQYDSIIDIHGTTPVVRNLMNSYLYNTTNFQPRTITKKVTDRNLNETHEIFYSVDFKDRSPYKEMCEKNLVCTPVEENFRKGAQNRLVRKTLHTYKKNNKNSQFVPEADYIYYQPFGKEEPSSLYGDMSLFGKAETTYADYDPQSNCTSIQSRMGQTAVYVWGYKSQYPIAQIFNATIEEVKAQGIDVDVIGRSDEPTQAQWQALHTLRTKLPRAEVIIMTYRPSVGITSKTDGRGITTYYEYDDMGRLNCIRDNDHNIIQTNHLKMATEK